MGILREWTIDRRLLLTMLKNIWERRKISCSTCSPIVLIYACSPRERNGPWDRIGRLPRDAPNERYPNKISPPCHPEEEKRVSLLGRGVRRHHSRVFSLTFIIQGIVLCSPESLRRVMRCRARCNTNSGQNVSTRVSGIYYFNHDPLPNSRARPRVSPCTWKRVATQTVCRGKGIFTARHCSYHAYAILSEREQNLCQW